MEDLSEGLNCEKINHWDMVQYLSSLGFEPKKVRGEDYWYLSPLREERTASFKVFRKGNVWYDHGVGEGGSLVDFLLLYFNCNLRELFEKLSKLSNQIPLNTTKSNHRQTPQKEIAILAVEPINSTFLQHYFQSRKIPLLIGQHHCKEVRFSMYKKEYTAIGFANRSGGYELRNAWFKGSSSPKDITLVQTGATRLNVFEGFFDFLTYETALKNPLDTTDFLILNSLAFVERSLPILKQYTASELYLDRGNPGRIQTQKIIGQVPNCKDRSDLYKGFDDLNEWHCSQSIQKKKEQGARLKHR